MKNVLIISFSDLASDPRVNRQIRFLSPHYQITAAGFVDPQIPGVDFLPLPQAEDFRSLLRRPISLLWKCFKRIFKVVPGLHGAYEVLTHLETLTANALGRQEQHYWNRAVPRQAWERIAHLRPDIIIANDSLTLPLAIRLKEQAQARVIFDAHEYAPLEMEDLIWWRWAQSPFQTWLCKKFVPQVDHMTTVSSGIADAYQKLTGKASTIVWNAPMYEPHLLPNPPSSASMRIRLIHHGAAIPSRKLELMIQMMEWLDERFELNLILVGPHARYRRWLEKQIARHPRIHLLPAVPMRQLPRFLNQFDIGLFLLPPTNFNYWHALPNKLFEQIQARLAIAIGPSPEMAKVVHRLGCGVVSDEHSPESLAECLNELTIDDINRMKQASHAHARECSAEQVRGQLLSLVDGMFALAKAAA